MIASGLGRPTLPGPQRGAFSVPKRVVLIGHPVVQSLSSQLHQAAFDSKGIDARYEPNDVPLINLPDAIEALRGDDYLGANIAFPYKERVAPMVDRLTEDAQATGAVDTITREGSRLVGHNTDVVGFRAALDELVGRQKMPKNAVIIGAGGGARAAVYVLITAGYQRVIVFNRHLHRAESLVRHFGKSASHMELKAMTWHESVIEAELAKAKVLINASAVADPATTSQVNAELLPPELLVLDLIYWPRDTKLLRDARAAGATETQNGDTMLLHQTAAAFNLWTGMTIDIDVLRGQLDAARDGGGPAAPGAAVAAADADAEVSDPAVAASE
jgi:shikimate dehydrogenase